MKLTKAIKTLFVCGSVLGVILWFVSTRSSQAVASGENSQPVGSTVADSDYVGSDACKDCHEDQFKAYSHTSHSQLAKIGSWKGKVTGCEACHGPGKNHIAEGDPAKIISFKNKSAKETGLLLNLSRRTIEHYFENIKTKLNCWNKQELLIKAKRLKSLGLL